MSNAEGRKLVVMMSALNEAKTIGGVIDGIPRVRGVIARYPARAIR